MCEMHQHIHHYVNKHEFKSMDNCLENNNVIFPAEKTKSFKCYKY